MQYFREGKLGESKRVTSSLLKQDPENLSVLSLHASILGSLDQLKQSRKTFNKILSINPDFRSANLNLIKLDLTEGKEEQARNSLKHLLKQQPDDLVLLYEEVKVEQATGNIELAIRLIEKLYHKEPKNLVINLHMMELYLLTGKANDAIKIGQKMRQKYPQNIQVLEVLGNAYLLAGDKKSALLMFKRMTREVTTNAKQLFRIALLQVKAGDLDEARWSLHKSINAKPGFYTAIVTLAELQIQTGRHENASELIKRLKILAPKNPMSLTLEGNLEAKKGNKQKAVKAYTAAHKKINSAQSVNLLFRALLSTGETDEAIKVLTTWSNSHPDRDDIKMIIADINYRAGDVKKAVTHYEELVSKNKATGVVYGRLAVFYTDKRKEMSLSYAQKAYKLAPENVYIADAYGWSLIQNGQVKEGLSLLRDAVSRNSTEPKIHYHLGVALEKLEQTKKAIKSYETAISFDQKFTGLKEAKQNLQRLKKLNMAK